MGDIRLKLRTADRTTQDANMARLRANIRRREVASYVAEGYSQYHPELQRMLATARSEEEAARIIESWRGR